MDRTFLTETLLPSLDSYPCADMRNWAERLRKSNKIKSSKIEDRAIEIIDEPNFGLKLSDLRKLSKGELETIFCGTHNLNIPYNMLLLLNPKEIIAKYLAAGTFKKYNSHKSNDTTPRTHFSDLVIFLDKIAFQNLSFASNSQKFKTRYSSRPKDQQTRLKRLNGNDKQIFVASFFSDYVPSLKEDQQNPKAYYDSGFSALNYADGIYRYLKQVYDRNH
jgi:hypothetical protein